VALRARLTILGLGEVALAVALWRRSPGDDPLRWSDPVGWLRTTTVENSLIEVGRVLVLALVVWMVLATAAAIVARVIDRIWGTTRWFAATSRVVPGFVATLVATAIATSAPVLAQTHTPIAPIGHLRDGRAPTTALTAPTPDPTPVAVPAPVAAPSPIPAPNVHVVATGESLWSIARDRVGADHDPLYDYWLALCDRNRAALASGDVDLIHPGEEIVLPSIDPA
jgi:hypothetical protein